jgi:6-phosphofructokinase 1
MKIGVLTAGGDAPGLNAALRAIGRSVLAEGHELIGIHDGWAGLVGGLKGSSLQRPDLANILREGGTRLGSIRYNLDEPQGGRQAVLDTVTRELDAVIAIGGDGTLQVAQWLAERGAPIVGVGKTLDNDLSRTEYCIGFDSAVSIVAEALDRLHTTAASHHRIMVVETMGRSTGWVATMGGLAGGADFIAIPEVPVTLDDITAHVRKRHERGSASSIVVIAEGVQLTSIGDHERANVHTDGIGRVQMARRSVGATLADHLSDTTGIETRFSVLGHLQRGGSPTAMDRIWATRVGIAAAELVLAGKFGRMPSVHCAAVTDMPISDAISEVHRVPEELWQLAGRFF